MRQFYWNGEGNFLHLVNEFQSEGMHVVEVGCYDGSTTRMYLDTVRKNNGHVTIMIM